MERKEKERSGAEIIVNGGEALWFDEGFSGNLK